jgi:PPOX class probable F420-dependent enzyme
MRDPVLSPTERAYVAPARRAVLATIAPDGRPRPVPICFVLDPRRPVLYTPLDEKPKTVDDPTQLARVTDVLVDSRVSVLVDRWDEDWNQLAWLRMHGRATLVRPDGDPAEHGVAVETLRAKYPQYATHDLETRPIIRIAIERTVSWGAIESPGDRERSPHPSGADSASSSSPADTRRR